MEVSASHKRWRHVQRLFADIVGLDPDRRAARLERVGRDDPRLREEVEALLDRHDRGEPLAAPSPPSRPLGRIPTGDSMILGEIVGHYCLLEEIGRGAMGIVYRAKDTRLGRSVALKFLSPQLSGDKRARARLEREAQAASALDHPNICTVYEIGETDDGRLYLALACYDGETLERRIERGPLAVDDAVRIAIRMARGLAAAHRHGIVHRDVKPSNVLVTEDEDVKILDFGIARVADSDLTGTGDTLGTAAYMSPEHLRGAPEARSDVWALGVVLYEMLTGRRPFGGDYEAALLYAVLHEEPAPLTGDGIPEELAEIVRRCLEKDPDLRYPSAEEVEVDLERLRLGEPAAHPSRRISRRVRRLIVSAGGLALLLVLLFSPLRTAVVKALGVGGLPDVQHLAVLPFVGTAAEASVGEGLAVELTHLLIGLGSRVERPVTVVSASDAREIATAAEARERFGVDVVIAGEFWQEKNEVVLTLDLVDARSSRTLRTERLREPTNRLPVLQQRALVELADMLGLPISEERRAMLTAGGTADAEAYEFYLKGEAALERADEEESIDMAIQQFEWALEGDSLYAMAHVGLCEAYARKFQVVRDAVWIEQAEHACADALRLSEKFAPVYATLGLLYNLTGDHQSALRELTFALSFDSEDATTHHRLAMAFSGLQRSREAEASFRRAIALQPQNWRPYNDLGTFFLRLGRPSEASSQFRDAIALAPTQVIAYENLGISSLYQGNSEEARRWLEKAIEIRPTYRAHANLATIYFEQEHYVESVRAYERALDLNDGDYIVWGGLGDALVKQRREGEAADAYRRAIDLAEAKLAVAPSSPYLLSDLAAYWAGLGQFARALDFLERVSINVSSDVYLAHRVAVLYETLGQRREALRWIDEALRRGLPVEEVEGDSELDALRADPNYKVPLPKDKS